MGTLGTQRPNHPVTKPNLGPLAPLQQANLLTLDCKEGKYSIYRRAQQGVQAAKAQKTKTLLALRERFLQVTMGVKATGYITFF